MHASVLGGRRIHAFTYCGAIIADQIDRRTARKLLRRALNEVVASNQPEELLVIASFWQYLPEGENGPVEDFILSMRKLRLPAAKRAIVLERLPQGSTVSKRVQRRL